MIKVPPGPLVSAFPSAAAMLFEISEREGFGGRREDSKRGWNGCQLYHEYKITSFSFCDTLVLSTHTHDAFR